MPAGKQKVVTFYIAGPMTGYKNYNKGSFEAAEIYLKETYGDINIINPVILDQDNGFELVGKSGNEHIPPDEKDLIVRRSINAVFECTHLFMLKGWERSLGARGEHAVGVWLNREIVYQP